MKRFTSIPVTPEFRDKLKAQKRGGENWEELLERLTDQCSTKKGEN